MRARRSSTIGTHDTPASDITILMFGKRIGIRAYTQSTAAMTPFTGNSVTATSVGLSPEGRATEPDAPTWRLTTVSVSSQARKNGSHASEYTDGNPRRLGVSGKVTARNPRRAFAQISSAASDGSASHGT